MKNTKIEPLDVLARFSWDWASTLCSKNHGCQAYHSCWSYIRLLEASAALPTGGAFFEEELSNLAVDKRLNILISGGADSGLLALAAECTRNLPISPLFHFTDRCKTTIWQNKLLAESLELELITYLGDIREISVPPMDVILAHSFLIFFSKEDRQQVVNAWCKKLMPGGVVMMSNALSADPRIKKAVRTAEEIDIREKQLLQFGITYGLDRSLATDIAVTASGIWHESGSRGVLSEPELRDIFESAGLEITRLEYQSRYHSQSPMGPPIGERNRRRAEISARKRE